MSDQKTSGEPFAWYTEDYLTDKSATTYDLATMERWKAKGWPVTPMYLNATSPVALLSKGFTTLETRDGKYRIITQYKNRDDAWSDYTALCKAEQPAPVAVLMPERLAMNGRGLMDAPTVNHHLGWNACLDELKRLNPSL